MDTDTLMNISLFLFGLLMLSTVYLRSDNKNESEEQFSEKPNKNDTNEEHPAEKPKVSEKVAFIEKCYNNAISDISEFVAVEYPYAKWDFVPKNVGAYLLYAEYIPINIYQNDILIDNRDVIIVKQKCVRLNARPIPKAPSPNDYCHVENKPPVPNKEPDNRPISSASDQSTSESSPQSQEPETDKVDSADSELLFQDESKSDFDSSDTTFSIQKNTSTKKNTSVPMDILAQEWYGEHYDAIQSLAAANGEDHKIFTIPAEMLPPSDELIDVIIRQMAIQWGFENPTLTEDGIQTSTSVYAVNDITE